MPRKPLSSKQNYHSLIKKGNNILKTQGAIDVLRQLCKKRYAFDKNKKTQN